MGNHTRRSQSVVPFGVGSIMEFEDEAMMQAGLEVWPDKEALRLYDDRLALRLKVEHFRVPPPKVEKGGVPGTMAPLPYVRFPRWHFCPRCRALKEVALFAPKPPRCDNLESSQRLGKSKKPCGELPERLRKRLRAVRFLVACEAGHVEDFPWNAWAHSKGKKTGISRADGCCPPQLYFYPTRMGGLSGLMVKCTKCGEKRSMMGSTRPEGLTGFSCEGRRPWLGGEEADESCSESSSGRQMLALQRGASNVYFPLVSSSILIPPFSNRIYQIIREPRVKMMLESLTEDGVIPDSAFNACAVLYQVEPSALREGYDSLYGSRSGSDQTPTDEAAFRFAEYRALKQERREPEDLLRCRPQEMSHYAPEILEYIAGVTLVERLAETRALTGFHRIRPNPRRPAALSRTHQPWLPAFRVHGEGIFLELRTDKLAEAISEGDPRTQKLLDRSCTYEGAVLQVTRELLLIHTLAHLLIKRLTYEAGYGASSIRERIYAGRTPEGGDRMAGLLLYTAAGDADGTLGGLVSQGRAGRLETIFAGTMEESRWCASDPICGESSGQGPDSMNLAACHACCLLPETSCEFQNRFLDRNEVNRFFGAMVLAAIVRS